MHRVVSDYTKVDTNTNSNIKVFVRARPLEVESDSSDFLVTDKSDDRKLIIKDPEASHKRYGEVSFQFDKIFWTDSSQEEVFDSATRQQVDHVLNGFNCCSFAYGQTGSGKTYTMFGPDDKIRGVIPQSVDYLFQSLAKKTAICEVAMVCSFLEIYNDTIRDLGKAYLAAMGVESATNNSLNAKTSDLYARIAGRRGNSYYAPAFKKLGDIHTSNEELGPGLKQVFDEYNLMNYEIREDNEGTIFVKDLSLVPVTTMEEVMSLIATGLRVRATHETKMNANSSRSHTVFTITVLQRDKITGEAVTGMLNLVDLAGSERLKKSESVGIRLKEALHINTSLTALGKVIMALDPSMENTHIPYRDSKLTRILQNSLGGNSFTTLIATIHPTSRYYEECLSTLQFANRCRNVRNNPKVNYVEDTEDKDRKIRKLTEELGTLRNKINQMSAKELRSSSREGPSAGVTEKMSAEGIVSLLKKVGIVASISPDGALLVNGRQFSIGDIGLGEGSTDIGGSNDGKYYGSTGDPNSTVNISKLNKQIKELKESNQNYALKSKERKTQMEEQGRQLQKLSGELVKLQTAVKHKEFEVRSLADEKERSLSEMKAFLEAKYAEELEGIIKNNRDLLTQHQKEIDAVPQALFQYTKFNSDVLKQKIDFEKPLKEEFNKHLLSIDKSRLDEIERLKKQYEYWLEEKDRSLSGFVDNFNSYRSKKSEQLRMAELELVRLYDYTEKLEEIINNAETGKFKVQVKGPGPRLTRSFSMNRTRSNDEGDDLPLDATYPGTVMIPKSSRPLNPMKLGATIGKKIVERHKERTARLERMQRDADQKALHYAAQTEGQMQLEEGQLESKVQSLLLTKSGSPFGSRPATADAPKSVPETNATTLRPSSAMVKFPSNRDIPGISEDKEYGEKIGFGSADTAELREREDKLGEPMGNLSPRPPSLGKLSKSPSLQKMVDIGKASRASSFRGDGQSTARTQLTVDTVEEERRRVTQSSRKDKQKADSTDKLNRELLKEVEELRELNKQRIMSATEIAKELSSNETVQYIIDLEKETERLKEQVKDINAQLHSAKVANTALKRKLNKVIPGMEGAELSQYGMSSSSASRPNTAGSAILRSGSGKR